MPFADVGPIRIESDLADENVPLHSDIPLTGYMGAETCDIQDGHVVAVWCAAAGAWRNPSLTLRTGPCHVQRYMGALAEPDRARRARPDRGHHTAATPGRGPARLRVVKDEADGCEKVVLKP